MSAPIVGYSVAKPDRGEAGDELIARSAEYQGQVSDAAFQIGSSAYGASRMTGQRRLCLNQL